jgi:hypothetical protein
MTAYCNCGGRRKWSADREGNLHTDEGIGRIILTPYDPDFEYRAATPCVQEFSLESVILPNSTRIILVDSKERALGNIFSFLLVPCPSVY